MSGKKRIKWWHILLSFVLVILVALGAVAALQYKNIMALYKGVTTDSETLKQAIADNQKETADALSNVGMNVSQDDFDKMNSGELTKEEISDILYNSLSSGGEITLPETEAEEQPDNSVTGTEENDENIVNTVNTEKAEDDKASDKEDKTDEKTESQPEKEQPESTVTVTPQAPVKPEGEKTAEKTENVTDVNTPQSTGTQTPEAKPSTAPATDTKPVTGNTSGGALSEAEYNKKVSDLVAQMYVIKSNFIGTLDSFEDKIMSAWDAQPKEMKTQKNKAKIIADNTAYLVGLEAQCDAQVKAVTDELRALMTAQGKDTSLVDSIVAAYEKEKENRKAYYISEYS